MIGDHFAIEHPGRAIAVAQLGKIKLRQQLDQKGVPGPSAPSPAWDHACG
jgi:hypothetical protein